MTLNIATGPHQGQPVLMTGEALDQAKAAMILIHGRGASAESILGLVDAFDQPGFVYLAPQAAEDTWYPYPFLRPISDNEPYLSSGLDVIHQTLAQLADSGLAAERTILLGFSQGACLSLEYAARHARRYAGIVGLSGGVIGPDGTPRNYPGSMQQSPVFLGCSDVDSHIPRRRVEESATVFRQLGADVTLRLYPNMGHMINQDEIDFVKGLMVRLLKTG